MLHLNYTYNNTYLEAQMRTTAPDQPAGNTASQLFTVRLWPHDLGDGQIEWRGKVQHVLSGETRYFRQWGDLVEWLAAIVDRTGM